MSLMRLLTAGKCFDGVGDSSGGRYRMRSANPLPKFGSDKNPFAKKTSEGAKVTAAKTESIRQDAPVAASAPSVPAAKVLKGSPSGAKSPAIKPLPVKRLVGPLPDTRPAPAPEKGAKQKNPFSAPVTPAARPVTAVPVSRRMASALGWTKYLNPLAIFSGRESRPARAARALPVRSAVQGELSLDKVKVVRNDLNDADLEVISAKPVPEALVEATIVPPPVRAKEPSAWNRLTAKFSRAEETTVP